MDTDNTSGDSGEATILDKDFKWGEFTTSIAGLPEVTLFALAQRGYTHVLGNEIASALTAWKKTEEGKAATQDQVDAWLRTRREQKIQQMLDGKLGTRVGAPRVTGIDAIVRKVAVEWLEARFKKQGKKLPTGDKIVKVGPEGQEKEMTREQLIEQAVGAADRLSYAQGISIKAEADRRFAAEGAVGEIAGDLFGE